MDKNFVEGFMEECKRSGVDAVKVLTKYAQFLQQPVQAANVMPGKQNVMTAAPSQAQMQQQNQQAMQPWQQQPKKSTDPQTQNPFMQQPKPVDMPAQNPFMLGASNMNINPFTGR